MLLQQQQEQEKKEQFPWTPIERKCISLLHKTKKSKNPILQIHSLLLRHAVDTNPYILSKLITTYAAAASTSASSRSIFRNARNVFDRIPSCKDDTFVCNSMIKAYVDTRQFFYSLMLYMDLRSGRSGFVPDHFTFVALTRCCALSLAKWEGLQLHCDVLKSGFCLDLFVSTGLVDMYAKFLDLGSARKLFDEMNDRNLVTWTVLMSGYLRCGDMDNARAIFGSMLERDCAVYNAMIDGYAKVGDMDSARSLFDEMKERNVISWTSMIYGYCNKGDVLSARSLFDAMPKKNLVSWNTMIGGYCQNRLPHEAFRLFHELQSASSFEPDEVTILSILPAIADLGALELGGWVHQYVRRMKLDAVTRVCTALVDMYAKCGEVSKARRVFDEMATKEMVSWNAMINGLAVNGCAKEALETFFKMQCEGVKPNEITMVGVLSACNHGGLVEEGKRLFKAMEEFGITPKIEHYGCMIDLLGRARRLEEAEKLIKSMPFEANGIILSSFLSACGYSKDIVRAERVLNQAINVDPLNEGNYVMLRNLFAFLQRWRDVEEVKLLMRRSGARKEAGSSAIEVDGRISEFIAGGSQHTERDAVQFILQRLLMHMRAKLTMKTLLY